MLVDQTQAGLTVTSDDIARVAEASSALGFYDPSTVLDTLANTEQLDHWASPTQYIQIDSPAGYPIGKSSNMGDLRLAAYKIVPGVDRSFSFQKDNDGVPLLILSRVLSRNGKPIAVAQLAERLDIIERETARARAILLVSAAIACLAVVIASVFIAASLVDPVVRLTGEMRLIGSNELDRRLNWRRGDEIGRLAATFDAMLDRLQDAFARERQFISDASHELKTPLTVINANAQLIRRWGDTDPHVTDDSLTAIIDESTRLAEMVGGMLTLSKAASGDRIPQEPIVLEPIVTEVVATLRERAEVKGLKLHALFANGVSPIMGDAPLIRQLVTNLVDNAIKFTESGDIAVVVEHTPTHARVEVRDTGVGITAETADRLFDRFFRGDESHSRSIDGTGLGLAIVRSIAHVHGGTVSAHPGAQGGSTFSVELPLLTEHQ